MNVRIPKFRIGNLNTLIIIIIYREYHISACTYLHYIYIHFTIVDYNHNSLLVQSVFTFSIQSCSNFIGYNFLYGSRHVKQYSNYEVGCSKIVRELRTAYIPGLISRN